MPLIHDFTVSSCCAFARGELTHYLTQILARAPSDDGFLIQIANLEKGTDAFHLVIKRDGILIEGYSLRACAYGVYALLKRAGCVFLAEDCEHIPQLEAIALDEEDTLEAPAFEYRDVYWTGALDGRFALKCRLNSARARIPEEWGGRMRFFNYSHSFEDLLPPETYFGSHPEYFSLVNGQRLEHHSQLCLTNPDVLRIATAKVREWMRSHPDMRIFSVAQNDWYSPCECPRCRAIDEREGSHAGTMISFVNAIADAAKDEFPDNFIHTFAYLYTRKAPRFLKPQKNVIIRLCSIECCFSHPFASCDHAVERVDIFGQSSARMQAGGRAFRDDLEEWSRICENLYVWDYTTNFANYAQPFPNLGVLKPNLQLLRSMNVKGVFEQGNYSPGRATTFADLKIFLLSSLLWDPDSEVESLTGTFLEHFFGPAAPMMRQSIAVLEKSAQNHHMTIFDRADAPYLDADTLGKAMDLMETALQAAGADPFRERVMREMLSVRYSQLVQMPLDVDERDLMVSDFINDAEKLGITELFERRSLRDSEQCLRESRWCLDRSAIPMTVYRL